MHTANANKRRTLFVGLGLLFGLIGLTACSPSEVEIFNRLFNTSINNDQADAACAQVESQTGSGTCGVIAARLYAASLTANLSPRELGQRMAAERGWTGPHWEALDVLWGERESGWDPNARNPRSGACGIPQALPCSKITDKSVAGQIRWGLDYIANTYGNPVAALAHSSRRGWY